MDTPNDKLIMIGLRLYESELARLVDIMRTKVKAQAAATFIRNALVTYDTIGRAAFFASEGVSK